MYCLPFQELKHFRDSFVDGKIAEHLSGHVPMLRMDGSEIDRQDQWRSDKIILHEFFVEIISLGFDFALPAVDEVTRGVTQVLRDERIDLWLVFGLQIFLDTQKILGMASKL